MRLRVLIVEDSVDDTKLLVRTLTKQGFEVDSRRVDTSETMRQALAESEWHVILADHTMPEFSALGALDTLKRSGLDIPFIIVSGLIGEDLAIEAMKAGAHDYIMKGSTARLVPAINRELAEAKVRRERRQAAEALKVAYAELERRVQERTAELATANEELAATNEELAAANEELAAASEELRLHQEREIDALKELDRKKDEFLSVAAHELKTPVTSLLGFAQVLLEQQERRGSCDPGRLNRGLKTMVRQSRKLAVLVTQLLDVSRIESGRLLLDRRCVDLAHVVGEVVAAALIGDKPREITVDGPPRAEAFVDPLRIEQVITNLVNNAVQHSSGGPVEVGLSAIEGRMDIAVRDHGEGIAPEHLPHIFERFYQADIGHHRAGLGLGLYISKQIVALHGGDIRVESPPGGGARFVVSLPACAAQLDATSGMQDAK